MYGFLSSYDYKKKIPCKYGSSCLYVNRRGGCKFSHEPIPCRNGINCFYNKNKICRYYHAENQFPKIIEKSNLPQISTTLTSNKKWFFVHNQHFFIQDFLKCHKQQNQCPICLQNYKQSNNFSNRPQITKLYCNHHFHTSCIQTWLKESNQCPFCRTDFRKHKDYARYDLNYETKIEHKLFPISFFQDHMFEDNSDLSQNFEDYFAVDYDDGPNFGFEDQYYDEDQYSF